MGRFHKERVLIACGSCRCNTARHWSTVKKLPGCFTATPFIVCFCVWMVKQGRGYVPLIPSFSQGVRPASFNPAGSSEILEIAANPANTHTSGLKISTTVGNAFHPLIKSCPLGRSLGLSIGRWTKL